MNIAWTDAQRLAIRSTGKSLLVSAAAGSGKTAVLAERCAYLVCDAPQPCDVTELLVVTFTEAAAAEMRGRIHDALARRVESMPHPDSRLLEQLALVPHAHISTIHGFCARLLRQNFSLAGIDPQFAVIDPDEAMLLRRQVARDLFDDRYEADSDERFTSFIDSYGDGSDEQLLEQVWRAHDMLGSLADPGRWLADAKKRLVEAAAKPLEKSEMGQVLLAAVQTALDRLIRRCAAGVASIKSLGGFPGYLKLLDEWSRQAGQWNDLFHSGGLDALVSVVKEFEPGKAPPVKEGAPNKERAKSVLDAVKAQMREGELSGLLIFTQTQWQQGQQAVAPFAALFIELVLEFRARYARAKRAIGGLDFADLEQLALAVLSDGRGPSPVARELHRRYMHVLVDEYQDVNEIQDAILRLVSAESVHEEGQFPPNLFAVGDLKQSVYRFRLADPRRFLHRHHRFGKKNQSLGEVIDLQVNFRGRPALLEATNRVFERLMTREAAEIEYDKSHRLHAPPGAALEETPTPIELHLLPSAREMEEETDAGDELNRTEIEALLCARRIQSITGKDGSAPMTIDGKPARYGDVAILLRSMLRKADDFADMLARHGIPVHNTGGAGFFDATEIRDMISLLSLLDNQRQDIPLAAFLRSPLAGLADPDQVLARIRLAHDKKSTPFHQAVVLYAAQGRDDLAHALRQALERLARWRDLANQRPLGELVWRIYDQTGYLTYAAGLDGGAQRVANLLYLHQRARQFGSFLKQGLYRFMSFLGQLRQETELSRPSISSEDQNAVRLMSIHRSKGLEFPIVILPDLGKRHNLSDANGSILLDRRAGLGLKVVDPVKQIRYPSLSWTLTSASLRRQTLAEELRVLYVAMTRAKERLILIGTAGENQAGKWAADFSGHAGPLPAERILSAGSILDWIGPVHAACGGKTIELLTHSLGDVQSWTAGPIGRPRLTDRQRDLAALKPLAEPPAPGDQAAAVISRLEYVYPHQACTTLQAAQAATAETATAQAASPADPPRIVSEIAAPLTPGQIGEATHLVLERLDYRRICDFAGVEAQIAQLVQRRLLEPAQAAAVDRAAIVWLAESELGLRLKAGADRLLREVPFAMADSADAAMIRGRIDLLVPAGDGVEIVDYKTDRISPADVPDRAAHHMIQMQVYRDALTRVAGKKVTGIHLVFLHPRVVFSTADTA